jgi:hypothetical protein
MYPRADTDIFVRMTDDSGREELIRGRVTASDEKSVTIRLARDVELVDGQELLVHYEIEREFMQQPVRVEHLGEPENVADTTCVITGDPSSAESRAQYRVAAVAAEAAVDVGQEAACRVLDVDDSGFSFCARTRYEPGRSLEVRFSFGGRQWPGTVVIMSAGDRGDERRYGVRCVEGPLKDAMAAIRLGVERQRSRRQAGREDGVIV